MIDKKTEHMEKRRNRGQTYREVAEEFNTSKSTAHRKIKKNEEEKDNCE